MSENTKPQGERNPGASVQAKLRNQARATGTDTSLLLVRYLIERFLYRLSLSPHRERFVLRGATLFSVWSDTPYRPTRDLDMLATGDSSPEALRQILLDICTTEVQPDDGVIFLPATLVVEERTVGRAYQGLYVEVLAQLGSARPRLELDLSFGEAITPAPMEIELPALLDKPRPRLRAYPQETVIAEKTEALVQLGLGNTRLKDFFDLWYLSRAFAFDGPTLAAALKATFTRRGTAFPTDGLPEALTSAFSGDPVKQSQWGRFASKIGSDQSAPALEALLGDLRAFLQPLLAALAEDRSFTAKWPPGGPWN